MRYEEIDIGRVEEIHHTITQQDIDRFVQLTGDDNRLHTDPAYAATTSFKKPVAHGMISASFISTMIGTRLPGDGALWYEQNLEFLLPVRVGDQITVRAEVIGKIDRLQAVEMKTEVFNQDRNKVINGTAKVKVVGPLKETKEPENETVPKNVLILGGSGGIGSATARLLASRGFNVALHYHANEETARAIKNEVEMTSGQSCMLVQADLSRSEAISKMLKYVHERFGECPYLVHSATVRVPNIAFDDLTWEDIQRQLDMHVQSFFDVLKIIKPRMAVRKYGKIVAITTQAVEYPFSSLAHYTTAKAALQGFTRSMALDLARFGIRLNMVSPGITDTDLNADLPEKARLLAASRSPLKRLVSPEDVAGAIAYLLSADSDHLTGETIRVNGGQIMN